MAWARLDPERAMNKKLRQAGFEARGLDDAAICQITADLSDGYISEDTVETLAVAHKCRHWKRLVQTLVDVGRWEPAEGGWVVHDYLEYNFSKEQVQADRVKKAEAGRRGGQASAKARASSPARAPAAAPVTANGQASSSRLGSELLSSSHGTHDPRTNRPDDDDVFAQAVALLADRALERRIAEKGPVNRPGAWLTADRRNRSEQHILRARELLAQFPGIDPAKLADLLEPPADDGAGGERAAFEAQAAFAKLPPCDACLSTGWADGDPINGKCQVCKRLLPAGAK